MNRYGSTRPDTPHFGSENQTAASYLRRGSKLAVGRADCGGLSPGNAQSTDDMQQTGGHGASKGEPQHGNGAT